METRKIKRRRGCISAEYVVNPIGNSDEYRKLRCSAEIAMLENNIVVYKFVQDLHFFVTGGDEENELILANVLQGFFDAAALLLRNNVDQREALENLDLILPCRIYILFGQLLGGRRHLAAAVKAAVLLYTIPPDAPLIIASLMPR